VVIDEWPMLRLGLARVLQTVDVRVVGEAGSRADGIRAAREEGAALVLVGDHSGGEPAEVITDAKALPTSPRVIVLVGQDAPRTVAAVLTAGADGLLIRSVGPDELASSVSRVLAGERVVSPTLVPMVIDLVSGASAGASAPRPSQSARPQAEVSLTAKEREVLAWLADGRSNQEIAAALYVTPATVKTHLAHIYAKLEVNGRHQALARAVALGYLR
jgi:DNA-binding NarL/FixJ family response regulator